MHNTEDPIAKLLDGYRAFRETTYRANETRYQELASQSQHPLALIISCCDSRADPAMVFTSEPGQLFVVRNVANLVPPYEPDGSYHSTSAAIEFAVTGLGVANIIVMGHEHCGGIRALYESGGQLEDSGFIGKWMGMAEGLVADARECGKQQGDAAALRSLEQRSVVASLARLRSFPFVAEREADGRLTLHGWYYGIGSGLLKVYDDASDSFIAVDGDPLG